jgi:hypothetical protein
MTDDVHDEFDTTDIRARAVDRAHRALDRALSRRANQPLPRVERIHNRLDAFLELWRLAGEHLDELHALAYDRPKAAERLRVRGGTPDYALDTHGDPRARRLYQQLVWELLDVMDDSAEACHAAVSFFKDGRLASGRRGAAGAISPEELAVALDAQRRRGDGPTRTVPQPTPRGLPTVVQLLDELEQLRAACRKVHPERLTKEQRRNLTTGQARAWQGAVPNPVARTGSAGWQSERA